MHPTHRLSLTALALGSLLGAGCASKKADVKPSVEITQPAPKAAVAAQQSPAKTTDDADTQPAADANAQAAAARPLEFPTVHFEFDSDVLTADGRSALDQFATDWRSHGAKRSLVIGGHTDERGSEEYNLVLGQRRANAVRLYLSRLGCPEEAIKTISYGENQPVDAARSDAAFAKNRRVEVRAN